MATKILVTGATGTTGHSVVEQLSKVEGIKVRAASRAADRVAPGNRVESVAFDYSDLSSIQNALQGVQKVYLVTPFIPELEAYESNVIGQLRQAGVQHVVKLSVIGAGPDSATPQQIHGRLEQQIRDTGIAYTFLRPSYFMQNLANYMSYTIKEHDAFFEPLGAGKRGMVDTRDIAAVAVKTLSQPGHEGQAYNLTGPEALSNYEVADILSEVLGRKIAYVDISEQQARQSMEEAGMSEWFIARMEELHRAGKDGHLAAVTHDLEKVLGVQPTSFRSFAADYADAFR